MTILEKIRRELGHPIMTDEQIERFCISPRYCVIGCNTDDFRSPWLHTYKLDYNVISDLIEGRLYWC